MIGISVVLAAGVACRTSAQVVRGSVVDSAGRPLPGVVVLMLDSAANVADRALRTERGTFRVGAARAGTFRLRTLRIGFKSATSEPIVLLAGGEVTRRLVLSGVSVALDTVRVVDRSSCHMSADSSVATVFAAWEQARTALTAAQLTAAARVINATTVSYDRVLEADGRRVKEQLYRIHTDYVTQTWRTVSADSLRRVGYVTIDSDNTTTYRAPGSVIQNKSVSIRWARTARSFADHANTVKRPSCDATRARASRWS